MKKAENKINSPHHTRQQICTIAINNGWKIQIVQILCEKRDGNLYLSGNILSRLTMFVDLSHKWVLKNFKHQEPEFYAILFNDHA